MAHFSPNEVTPLDRLMPMSEVAATLGISRSSAYRHIANGLLPRPIKVGVRSFFSEREIQAWIQSQLSSRNEEPSHD
jgi:predicted DNA-binding transcriptional regulator AlpA